MEFLTQEEVRLRKIESRIEEITAKHNEILGLFYALLTSLTKLSADLTDNKLKESRAQCEFRQTLLSALKQELHSTTQTNHETNRKVN